MSRADELRAQGVPVTSGDLDDPPGRTEPGPTIRSTEATVSDDDDPDAE